jgi:hypothetical protein
MVLLVIDVKRVGNWYSILVNERTYNVLIQKEPNKVTCDVSSIIVFDEDFTLVENKTTIGEIETIMSKMDWKYDMLDT